MLCGSPTLSKHGPGSWVKHAENAWGGWTKWILWHVDNADAFAEVLQSENADEARQKFNDNDELEISRASNAKRTRTNRVNEQMCPQVTLHFFCRLGHAPASRAVSGPCQRADSCKTGRPAACCTREAAAIRLHHAGTKLTPSCAQPRQLEAWKNVLVSLDASSCRASRTGSRQDLVHKNIIHDIRKTETSVSTIAGFRHGEAWRVRGATRAIPHPPTPPDARTVVAEQARMVSRQPIPGEASLRARCERRAGAAAELQRLNIAREETDDGTRTSSAAEQWQTPPQEFEADLGRERGNWPRSQVPGMYCKGKKGK